MPQIKFENGVVVNVEGNPTQADIDEIAQKVGVQGQQSPGGVTGAFKSGWQGLKESLSKRVDNTGKAINADQGGASKTLQVAGQGFGTIGDVIGAGIGTAASAVTPDKAEMEIKDKFAKGVEKAMGTQAAQNAVKALDDFKKENPELAGNIGAIGNIADAFLNAIGAGVATKGAKKVGTAGIKTAKEVGEGVAKAGYNLGEGIKKISGKAVKGAEGIDKEGIAQTGASLFTGMEKGTVEQILKNPDRFSKEAIESVDRESVFNQVRSALDKRLNDLSDTGEGYQAIRESKQTVNIPENFIDDSLKGLGFKIEEGKIIPSTKSATRKKADINALQSFYNNWSGSKTISPDEFLNMRSDLADLANYGAITGKTKASENIAKKLRAKLNEVSRKDLVGLDELDANFSKEKKVLDSLRKELYNRDGTLKNNAMSTIANLTNKGNELKLKKIEELVPGIADEVNILKAIEDIERAQGVKVGTYLRGGAGGFIFSGGNPLVALMSAVASAPQVSVPALRAISKNKSSLKEMIDKIKK